MRSKLDRVQAKVPDFEVVARVESPLVGPRRKSSGVRFCAAVRGIADIQHTCLDVVNSQGHRRGDPIDGEIGIGQLGAGLG